MGDLRLKDEQEVRHGHEPAEDLVQEHADAHAAPTGDGSEPMSDLHGDPEQVIAQLQVQVEDLRGKWLRSQADFDNFRKRTRQEREELATFANAKLITDLLPVLDHFSMAVAAADAGGTVDSLAKGVDMVYKQLLGVMENAGLRAMDPIGQPFDPNRHEAVMQEPVDGVDAGHVASVLRTGYLLGERVLRPAMVKISQ